MAHPRNSGFTIVETSLVLAVTGLLIAMVLTGIGSSLNHERYTDAVAQALDFFRGQYSQTTNVLNNRPSDESCNSSGITTLTTGTTRGASDCLLLGNVLRSSDGKTVTVNQVIARHDPSSDTGIATKSDKDILLASLLQQGNQTSSYTVEWGSSFLQPGTQNPARFSMMVVRVPVSGTVETYTSNSDTTKVTDLITVAQADMKLCVDQTGFMGIGVQPMGVLIQKGAANTTGVQPITSGKCV
jgi:type II secretory pathway pseudopilin PulG